MGCTYSNRMCEQVQPSGKINECRTFLETCLRRKVLSYTLKPLTKPGDNFGSIMQSIDVEVAGENNPDEKEILRFVSKTVVKNPYLIEIFQPELTFVKEAYFYSDIIPAIKIFERMCHVAKADRIDAFIRCPGSRISLNPNASHADSDAVLLLENTKYQNYTNENRLTGFDTGTALAILKRLAKFHALCIAMRRLQPQLFNTRIALHLRPINMTPDDDDTNIVDGICDELKYLDDLDSEMRTTVEKQLKICDLIDRDTVPVPDTPYTTVVHRDLWTNNIMIKMDLNAGQSIDVKIYDFQLYFYESFACDLIFFLFTSVGCNDLIKNFKLLIYHYHLEFIKTLILVNCPREDYTFDKMWNEIKVKAKIELLHSLHMVKVVMADESTMPSSLDEVTQDTFCNAPTEAVLNRWKCILDVCKDNKLIKLA